MISYWQVHLVFKWIWKLSCQAKLKFLSLKPSKHMSLSGEKHAIAVIQLCAL